MDRETDRVESGQNQEIYQEGVMWKGSWLGFHVPPEKHGIILLTLTIYDYNKAVL